MPFSIRKSFNLGPARATVSKSGVGASIGFLGFRIGRTATGRRYLSFTIPGTGILLRYDW